MLILEASSGRKHTEAGVGVTALTKTSLCVLGTHPPGAHSPFSSTSGQDTEATLNNNATALG